MRDCLQSRSAHDLMRLPLRHDSSPIKHNDFVAEAKHFFAIVSNEENRDTVILVPLTKIRDERRLRWPVQRRQWLIDQQGARVGTADNHGAYVGIAQRGDAIEQRAFSAARCAEQNRKAGKRAEADIQVEGTFGTRKTFADSDFEIGRDWMGRNWRRSLWRGSSLRFCFCFYRHGPTAHGGKSKSKNED